MIKLRIRYTDDAITDLNVIFSYIEDDSREIVIGRLLHSKKNWLSLLFEANIEH